MARELITTKELARRTGVSAQTWAKRRMQGYPATPRFIKSGRLVRYSMDDVEEWFQTHLRSSTSDS